MPFSCQVLMPFQQPQVGEQLLTASARHLRAWMEPTAEEQAYLRKYNDIDMVLLLTGEGPKYILKSQTCNCRRVNRNLYYNHSFVNVLFALMLQKHGKSEAVFLELTQRFASQGSPCALLGTRNRLTRRQIMEDVWSLPQIQDLHTKLIDRNINNAEWSVLSHDATFKSLFNLIGQEKMSQQPGEAHALHSLLGLTGALPGLSLQRSEGPQCFNQALTQLLPQSARSTTRWIFSDTPDSIQAPQDLFPNLQGIAEDPLHFVLRVETCFGERRTSMSRDLLHLQKKFSIPFECPIYKGERPAQGQEGHVQQKMQKFLPPGCKFHAFKTVDSSNMTFSKDL